jgi:hypothetical protein
MLFGLFFYLHAGRFAFSTRWGTMRFCSKSDDQSHRAARRPGDAEPSHSWAPGRYAAASVTSIRWALPTFSTSRTLIPFS